MFDQLARIATRRYALVLAATLVFAAYGVHAFRSLSVEAFPDVTNPMVDVIGLLPGQAAEEVEQRVTVELERVLAGTPGLTYMRSVSVFGLSLVTLTFDDASPLMVRRTMVAERLRDANLPELATVSLGPQATPVGQIFRYTLRGPKSLRELRAIQDFVIERRLRAVPGVADVVTFGGYQREYQVRVDPVRLAAADVSVADVYAALEHSNGNEGGGYVGIGAQQFIVRGVGNLRSPTEIGDAVVRESRGVPVRVRDVAQVVEGSTPRQGSVGRDHADDVVEGIVLLRRGENPSDVLVALHQRIDDLNAHVLPRGVRIEQFYDRQTLVDATLMTVFENLLEGAVFVLLCVYAFLQSKRAVLIIAVVMPVSLLTAFVGLHLIGLPANLISLGAIDFGILVDGAIIVLEATLHMLAHEGDRPAGSTATVIEDAVQSVARPVGFAMLIILAALAPIFALESVEGRIFAPMAYTYAFALVGALLAAMLVTPALAMPLFRNAASMRDPSWLRWLAARYERVLRFVREHGRATAITLFAVVAALFTFVRGIGSEFLPELNEGGLYITAIFPPGIALDETRREVHSMRETILRVPEVAGVLSHIGRPEDSTQIEGPNNAEFFVKLVPEREFRRGIERHAIEAELRTELEEIPGVQYNFSQPITDRVFETISGIIGQVVVKVHGDDLAQITEVAQQVRSRLAGVRGVSDLSIYQAGDVPQLRIDLDRLALARRGLSIDDAQQAVRVALAGETATRIFDGERRFDVAIRLPNFFRENPEELGLIVVGDPSRRTTLGEVADVHITSGRATIWREDFSRFVAAKFNVRGRDLGSTVEEAQRVVGGIRTPEGVYTTFAGEFQNKARALARLTEVVPVACFAIAGILYAIFRRFSAVFAILAYVPIGILGAFTALRIAGENFSVSAAVGCIALIGQMVLSGVVLVSRIQQSRIEGSYDPEIHGATLAMRPVLLTATLAAFGLLPAALAHAMGSETQRPFALSIVGGVFLSTPVLLFTLPMLLSTFERFANRRRGPASAATAITLALLTLLSPVGHVRAQPVSAPSAPAAASVPPGYEGTFTLEDAIARMRRSQPLLAAARAGTLAAEGDEIAAGLWENPSLSADYFLGVRQSSYDRAGTAVATVQQFVELAGVPRARRAAARAERIATEFDAQVLERALALDVRIAMMRLAAAYARLDVAVRATSDLDEAARIVQARVREGASPRYDERRMSLAVAQARSIVDQALAEVARARGTLNVAVGPEASSLVGRPAIDAGPAARADLATLIERLERERPDLLAARARADAARARVSVARREVFRGIAVRAGGGFGQGPGQVDVGAGVSVPLPLVDRGQGRIDAAAARAEAAEHVYEAAALAARQRLTAAYDEANVRREALERFAQTVQTADEDIHADAESSYRDGRLSVLELVDAYTSVREGALRRIELSLSAAEAEVQLVRVLEAGGASVIFDEP